MLWCFVFPSLFSSSFSILHFQFLDIFGICKLDVCLSVCIVEILCSGTQAWRAPRIGRDLPGQLDQGGGTAHGCCCSCCLASAFCLLFYELRPRLSSRLCTGQFARFSQSETLDCTLFRQCVVTMMWPAQEAFNFIKPEYMCKRRTYRYDYSEKVWHCW